MKKIGIRIRIFLIYVTLFNSGMGNRTGVLNASKVIASKDSRKQIYQAITMGVKLGVKLGTNME